MNSYHPPRNDFEIIQNFYNCPKGAPVSEMIERFQNLRKAGEKLDDAYTSTLIFALNYYLNCLDL